LTIEKKNKYVTVLHNNVALYSPSDEPKIAYTIGLKVLLSSVWYNEKKVGEKNITQINT
jgi:hypothetical protein